MAVKSKKEEQLQTSTPFCLVFLCWYKMSRIRDDKLWIPIHLAYCSAS